MTTIYQDIKKHFTKDREKARQEGYKKGYKDAMKARFQECGRNKSFLEKIKLVFQL